VVKAAQAKKHVLAEKPFASVSDLKTMVHACQENGVHFMDNTMWIHHDRTKKIKNDHLENGFILNRVSNNFSFFNENAKDIRYNTSMNDTTILTI
jgi:predicted dehydrogenase